MTNNNLIAATAADYQVVLTNEMGACIQKHVLFFLKDRKVSAFEKEMIAENAWSHVVVKSAKFTPTEKAKFSTWAKKVALNFAVDELRKLNNDPLHMTGLLYEDQPASEDDARMYSDTVSPYRAFGSVGDCIDQLDMQDAIKTLRVIVASYAGRDRIVGEMLLGERTKEEIMAETQMTGGNVDTCKCRLLKKMRADLLEAGYSLAA